MAEVTDTYYAGEAEIGYGAQFLVGLDDGSPETFVAVADVISMKPGKMSAGILDKTHLRSPDRTREKIVTLFDADMWTIRMNWRPDHGSQSNAGGDGFVGGGLLAILLAGAERNFKIKRVDNLEIPFRGAISGYEIGEISIDQKTELIVEITPLRAFAGELP